jgi:hypothetical protein
MSTDNRTKINQLLVSQPPGVVLLSSWLTSQGYSFDLQKRYRKSNWLEAIGSGAMIRTGDKIGYEGAIYALQTQAGLTIHPGGRTALSLQGKAHYLELSTKKITLFGGAEERLPGWFQKHNWEARIEYYPTSFLPFDAGLTEIELNTFSIKVSTPARAIMECLYLTPEKQELLECYELMEGLNNVKPQLIQSLLEQCQSVKVKRLFLYMAEKAGHDWFKYLELKNVDLGKGNRSIVKNGAYVPKYFITVPRELEAHGKSL